ncbi:hypothetical protein ACFLQN_01620 [Candidatus Aenigmatarchaeota archaeon]
MGFNYSYKPGRKNDTKSKIGELYDKTVGKVFEKGIGQRSPIQSNSDQEILKGVVVVVSIFVLLGLVGMLGSSYTGLATNKLDVEQQLAYKNSELSDVGLEKKSCETNLFNTIKRVDDCEAKAENKADDLVACMKQNNDLETYSNELNSFYTECEKEKTVAEEDYENALEEIENVQENYDIFVRNSVRSTCCSINDILNEFTKNFGVTDNQVICNTDGQFTINCGTGDTNY